MRDLYKSFHCLDDEIPRVKAPLHLIFFLMNIWFFWNWGTLLSACINESGKFNQCTLILGHILAHGITVREFLPSMYRNNKGHVVTIASIAGTCAVPNQMDYNCSKFAAFAFDEGLRGEIRKNKKNVKTLCFCPYFVDTGMFDGAKSKYPLILPILKTDWVCDRIVNAIRQEEKVVITPFIGTAIFMMRYIMPVTAFDYDANIWVVIVHFAWR